MSNAPIVIVGTGLAGYSLAREFRKLNQEKELLIITQDDGHSYSKPMLSTGFTKQKSADDLSMGDPAKMVQQLKASIRTQTEVSDIHPDSNTIMLGTEALEYDKLVLATGADVNKLQFEGSDHEKVVSINDLEDYRHFRNLLNPDDHVLIMGAGLIGCEYANDLLNGGYSATIVDPSTSALSGLIPKTAGDALVSGLSSAGAKIELGRYVKAIVENEDGSLTATLDDDSSIEANLIISAVGLKPRLGLAQKVGLECDRGIQVDRTLRTSQKDIYALGDCAEVDGRVMLYVLPLMASARALAKTLNGEETQVSYGVMPVATKTPACPVIVQPPLDSSATWHFEQDGNNVKGLCETDNGELSGFVLTGDYISEKQALAKMCPPIHND